MNEDVIYYIYRSRFQPEFHELHKKAVKKFFNLKEGNLQNAGLVLGIVDEHLFMMLYSKQLRNSIKQLLENTLGKGIYEQYTFRFKQELNPKNVGAIIKSIWENWREIFYYQQEPIKYTVVCNAAWSGLALYQEYSASPLREARAVLLRWLPISDPENPKPEHIGWYFPIFDSDDLNDMGFISSLMWEYFRQGDEELEKRILFARFNYNHNKNYIYSKKYGAYAKILHNHIYNFDDFWNTQTDILKKGFEVIAQENIPFVFHWHHILRIYEKLREIMEKIKNNTSSSEIQTGISNILERIDGRIKDLKDPQNDFYEDTSNFHNFFRNLLDDFPWVVQNNVKKEVVDGIKEVSELITQKHESDGDWLEDNLVSTARFNSIINKLNEVEESITTK